MLRSLSFAVAASLLAFAGSARGDVQIYLSQPQTQTVDASATGALTSTFDAAPVGGFATLASPIGTYTSLPANAPQNNIRANDQYGGNSLGNYLSIEPGGSVSVALSSPQAYFGMFFTAADASDTITLYDAVDSVLASFSTQTLTTFLAAPTVTSTNGTPYSSNSFKGQPGTGANNAQYYAYLNFIVTSGANISRVGFSKASGGAFESDNHSISSTLPAVANSATFINLGAVPEPATVSLMVLGGLALGGMMVRRRRSATV